MPGSSPDTEIKPDAVAEDAIVSAEVLDDQASSAESSTAEDQGEKGDMLSAVKAALKPKEKAPASDEPGSKSDEPAATDAAKEAGAETGSESDDLTEEELARLRPKTRKRIENLVRDRNERDGIIAGLEPKAQQFDKIAGFVSEAGLSKEEVNDGFAVMSDLKNAPYKAYQRLKPIMAQLANMFGEGDLPDDLRQDVARGAITEMRARELVAARGQTSIATKSAEEQARREEDSRRHNERQTTVNDVSTAVTEWENSKSKSDPSWKLKQPRVMELVELEIARKQQRDPQYFPTKAEALGMAETALKRVDEDLKRFTPKPRAVTPTPDAASTRSLPKPTSALEAAKQGLAKMAG
jgi:hypothetical protein